MARELDVPLGSATRPSWRGRLHLIGLAAAVPLTVVLAIVASGGRAHGGVIVYAVGLCSMLAVSVTYHRWVHTVRARAAWRRADHATIYAAIGGTFTPLCLLAFGTVWRVVVLVACGPRSSSGRSSRRSTGATPTTSESCCTSASDGPACCCSRAAWSRSDDDADVKSEIDRITNVTPVRRDSEL